MTTLQGWIDSRETANEKPHPYIVSRLKKLPTDVLRRLYQVSLDKAKNDAEWLFFLKEEFGYLDV